MLCVFASSVPGLDRTLVDIDAAAAAVVLAPMHLRKATSKGALVAPQFGGNNVDDDCKPKYVT